MISKQAEIGTNVHFGYGVRVYDNATIGNNCVIEDHSIIGCPTLNPVHSGKRVLLREDSIIRSHNVVYEGSSYGPALESGHHVILREGTEAGTNLRVGNHSDIEGDCLIGDYCRFHGYVHVGKGSRIGNFVWLFSLTTLTNDPLPPSHHRVPVIIDDGAVLAVGATPLPGAVIGKGSFISAGSQVRGQVPAGAVVVEGRVVFGVHRLCSLEHNISHPWISHYKDKFPKAAWVRLDELHRDILKASKEIE